MFHYRCCKALKLLINASSYSSFSGSSFTFLASSSSFKDSYERIEIFWQMQPVRRNEDARLPMLLSPPTASVFSTVGKLLFRRWKHIFSVFSRGDCVESGESAIRSSTRIPCSYWVGWLLSCGSVFDRKSVILGLSHHVFLSVSACSFDSKPLNLMITRNLKPMQPQANRWKSFPR